MEGRLSAKIDGLAEKMDKGFERITGLLLLPKTLDAHGERLRDHERRLRLLESAVNV